MIKITVLNKDFNGVVSNISFINGVATVDTLIDDDKRWFERYGAIVETVEDNKKKSSKK